MNKEKDAYYFSHDSNARHDPKMKALIFEFGMAGYGAWWVLVEMLREQTGYCLPNKPYVIQAFADDAKMKLEDADAYIKLCVDKYELLVIKNGMIYSPSLLNRMSHLDAKRQKRVEAGRKGGLGNRKAEVKHPLSDAGASKGKETTAKKTTPKKDKPGKTKFGGFGHVLLTSKEYKTLRDKLGKEKLEKCIDKLDLGIEAKGYQYKSHNAAMYSWVIRAVDEEEERKNGKSKRHTKTNGQPGKYDSEGDGESL